MQISDSHRKVADVIVEKRTSFRTVVIVTLVATVTAQGLASILSPMRIGKTLFGDFLGIAISVFIVFVIHELLHAFAFHYWGKEPLESFRFGYSWQEKMLYCQCLVPVEVRVFRIALLLPLVVIGALTLLGVFIYPSSWTATVMGIAIGGCATDVYIFLKMRQFDEHFIVVGHPSVKLGYQIFAPPKGCLTDDA